jgi:hypothetical protein
MKTPSPWVMLLAMTAGWLLARCICAAAGRRDVSQLEFSSCCPEGKNVGKKCRLL